MATTSTAPIKQEVGAPGSPSPMQPSALEPGTISRKRPEPQGAIVPFAGSSTDVPAKKARTIKKPSRRRGRELRWQLRAA